MARNRPPTPPLSDFACLAAAAFCSAFAIALLLVGLLALAGLLPLDNPSRIIAGVGRLTLLLWALLAVLVAYLTSAR